MLQRTMMFTAIFTTALFSIAASTAEAATVATGGTGSTGAGGFTVSGGTGTIVDMINNSPYFAGATDPASNWVWDSASGDPTNALTFNFAFSLDGFDLSTASLSGLWGIDNVGNVYLNGNLLDALLSVVSSNYQVLHAFSAAAGSGFFLAGDNVLSFDVEDSGGAAAFRASVSVSADIATIPLPAALPLFLAALGGLGFAAHRRQGDIQA